MNYQSHISSQYKLPLHKRAVFSSQGIRLGHGLVKGEYSSRFVPKAPSKLQSSDAVTTVDQVSVKRLCNDNVAVYVGGDGHVVSMDFMDEGKWWSMPNLGTSKLRSEEIYGGKKSLAHPARVNPLWAQRMVQEYSKPGNTILDLWQE